MVKVALLAIEDTLRRFFKSASPQMIRRMMLFENLAGHQNPQLAAVGKQLLQGIQRSPPRAIAPADRLRQFILRPGTRPPMQITAPPGPPLTGDVIRTSVR
jgi:hypothetical protein